MPDVLRAVERFRSDAKAVGLEPRLQLEKALVHCYPVSCVFLPALSVQAICDYLRRHEALLPRALVTCRDRRLRGGIVAQYGYGILFVDRDDPEAESRFTLAHEAKHFLADHLYPRLDLLARFGSGILPVLDGHRPPSREERIDALLARTDLAQQTHLLDRETRSSSGFEVVEADADAFASELLAPAASLWLRFPHLFAEESAVTQVHEALVREYALPAGPAMNYARAWVAEQGKPRTLLHRLGLA
ncbi:MAG: hypothetical protein JWN14_1475 [Chthonomonadales bacterium]|nr:hypothetical protein [Chthonomonadales bacterium]